MSNWMTGNTLARGIALLSLAGAGACAPPGEAVHAQVNTNMEETEASAPSAPLVAKARVVPQMKMTTEIPPSITTPDLVSTSRLGDLYFVDGFPTKETQTKVYDHLDFLRGVEAFLSAIPGASVEAARVGLASMGATDNQTVLVMESLMDSRSLFLTPNTESIYCLMWVDTKEGPLVIETPPNVLGVIDDHWFQYVGDVGNAGPDKGKGGKYLLLPPGYTGAIPQGYHVLRSGTYGNLFFWRGFVEDGSTKPAVDATKKFAKVYPLSAAKKPPEMKFIDVSGKKFNTIGANDFQFYEDVNKVVQYEPAESFHPEVLGMLASIGIIKGTQFSPDTRMKEILNEAVAVGNATARTIVFQSRMKDAYYYPDSAWFTAFVGGDYRFLLQPGVRNLDARTLFHYYATGVTPAMALKLVGKGSQYAGATRDAQGAPLDGSKTYKIHLPPNIPAQNFWSFVVYDNQTRSMLQTDEQFPSIGSQRKGLVVNADTSVDVWFGPKAPKGHESNWVQTVPGKGWNVLLRLYGPEESWFDKSWRPGEFEVVDTP